VCAIFILTYKDFKLPGQVVIVAIPFPKTRIKLLQITSFIFNFHTVLFFNFCLLCFVHICLNFVIFIVHVAQ
jgi:hypothetical protein